MSPPSPPPGGVDTDRLFRALVENSSDAIALVDAEGVITFASQSSARVLGYEPDERIGRSAFELLHPDDLADARTLLADCLRRPGAPIQCEYRMRHKDGSWRSIEATAMNRMTEPAVGAVVVNYRDVTERKRAEEALRASQQRLGHIVEHAQDLIYYCDPNGRFTYVNPTVARVTKYTEDELIGRHFMTLIRPDYRAQAGTLYARQIAESIENTYFEFPAVTKDGETIWVGQHVQLVYDGGAISGVHAITRDITRQKDAEDGLRRSEARYRSLIQDAAYGIYRTTMDGSILDANPALARMLGYDSAEELMARNMIEAYYSPADRAALVARFGPQGSGAADVTWKRKDGTPLIVRLTARVVDLPEEGPCFEGIAEDITEKRALEEQLRQAQKMEAVGQLARGIAHDFNNVLAAIVGCCDLLALRLPANEPARIDTEEIRKAAERGATLTRQLLTFSRGQAVEPQVLDVHAIARGFESMLLRLMSDGVKLQLETPGAPPLVRVEPGQIEQVLLNLVVNARDAMPEGGTIDVRIDAIALDATGALQYPAVPAGRYARMAVRDTGVGIDPDAQRHVFEPFFTTKGSKGTGLGLSIVYGIATEAGGSVTFSTAPNVGTTFEVLLPLVEHV